MHKILFFYIPFLLGYTSLPQYKEWKMKWDTRCRRTHEVSLVICVLFRANVEFKPLFADFFFPITGNVGYQKKFITIDLQVININIKIIHTIINFKLFKNFLS
jgi:hypothetical protein